MLSKYIVEEPYLAVEKDASIFLLKNKVPPRLTALCFSKFDYDTFMRMMVLVKQFLAFEVDRDKE